MTDCSSMRCYYVIVHGKLSWRTEPIPDDDELGATKPRGFYRHRYVLARNPEGAQSKAFQRVCQNLEEKTRWLSLGFAKLELEVEELTHAPMYKLLQPDNRGHVFYNED